MKIYIDIKNGRKIYYMEKDVLMYVKIGPDNLVNFRDATEIDFSKLNEKAQKICQKIKIILLN